MGLPYLVVQADPRSAIGEVMKNWPHVFAILNMLGYFLLPVKPTPSTADLNADKPSEGAVDGEVDPIPKLVRLPYTEDDSQ